MVSFKEKRKKIQARREEISGRNNLCHPAGGEHNISK